MGLDDTGQVSFPTEGTARDALLAEIDAMRGEDIDWRRGRAFSLVYNPADDELEHVLHAVADRFLHENALNPFAYTSLPRMEREVIAMAADLLGSPADAGSLTSGGTESIFLAIQVARDHARAELGIESPQIITATTAHPAFAKACKYLDVEQVKVEIGDDLRLGGDQVSQAMGPRVALLVASAPCYPYGVIDHVGEVAALAAEHGILCHVDACLGGWMLPFWERMGEDVVPWDFRVHGVTSLSADIHKYGYAFKGASILLHRSRDLLSHQFFLYDEWPGGLYGSSTTAGTRPGPPIAGAWAAIRALGESGYMRLAERTREATRIVQVGIAGIDGLEVTGDPDMSVFEISTTPPGEDADDAISAIGDVMDDKGWHLDRQNGGLHLMFSPYHLEIADQLVTDLTEAAATHGESRGTSAVYGGVA
jgi:glutamate/tyrosine decarboxylase-like PLP-dependent enzyme